SPFLMDQTGGACIGERSDEDRRSEPAPAQSGGHGRHGTIPDVSIASAQPDRIRRAANSPIITQGAFVFAEGIVGMTEASPVRRPSTPWTRSSASTTASRPEPFAQVPTGWE